MDSSLEGRIRNTKAPQDAAIRSLYEAVVNSIQSIQSREPTSNDKITIKMIGNTKTIEGKDSEFIDGFEITDNGPGFDKENFGSFKVLDSLKKSDLGCKGIGRLMWLKAFNDIRVDSVYEENGTRYLRQFSFSIEKGIYDDKSDITTRPIQTTVKLKKCRPEYQQKIPSTTKTLSKSIFNHCISYFLSGKVPQIEIVFNDVTDNVNELMKDIIDQSSKETVNIAGFEFVLTHVKFYSAINEKDAIVLCANGLEVEQHNEIDAKLVDDKNHEFRYRCYVMSKLLDENVTPGRDGFTLALSNRTLTNPNCPSINEIINAIKKNVELFLKPYMNVYRTQCEDVIKKFIDTDVGKQFTSVLEYDTTIVEHITPNMTDEQVYKVFSDSQTKFESQILFKPKSENQVVDDTDEIEQELRKVSAIQKDNLTRLILHRNLIISTYKNCLNAITKNSKYGFKYEEEKILHDLILPRRTDKHGRTTIETCNLWILDERLYSYAFQGAYSDKRLCDISKSNSKLRPDIFIFGDVTDDLKANNVAIIELKRPQRKDENIISQIYDYVDALKNQQIYNYTGNIIQITDETTFFCYAICDTSSQKMTRLFKMLGMRPQFGGKGYFTWNDEFNASIEAIDPHKIFADAKQRNTVFFKLIGLEVNAETIEITKGSSIKIIRNAES